MTNPTPKPDLVEEAIRDGHRHDWLIANLERRTLATRIQKARLSIAHYVFYGAHAQIDPDDLIDDLDAILEGRDDE